MPQWDSEEWEAPGSSSGVQNHHGMEQDLPNPAPGGWLSWRMRREAHPWSLPGSVWHSPAPTCSKCRCRGCSVVLGSLRAKGTAERQDILVLPVPHLQLWLGRGVKEMRVEGSGFCRKMGRVHSALNESCKTS